VAGLPVDDLLARVSTEPYPPLYHLALGVWLALVPASEWSLRLPSVVCGLVAVAVGWRWAHEALGRWHGLIAAIVLALSPLALANARDARMYALETAFAVTAWWLTWRLIAGRGGERPVWKAVALTVAVAGELWTLALGLGVAGLQGLVALGATAAALRGADPARRRGALTALGAIVAGGLLFLPWLPRMLGMAVSTDEFWTVPVRNDDWLLSLQQMLGGWSAHVPYDPRPQLALLVVAGLGVIAAIVDRDPARRRLGWCLAAGIAFVGLVWAVSLGRSIYDTRYLAAALPAVALAIAAGTEALGRAAAHAAGRLSGARSAALADGAIRLGVAALAISVTGIAAGGWLADWRREGGLPPTKQLFDELARRARPGDVLLALDARSYFPIAWELDRRARLGATLPVAAYDWEPPGEPFFRGQSLLDPAVRVTPDEAAAGWSTALPGLAPGGRVWLVALANDRDEDLGFDPLDAGELREVERIVVEPVDEAGQALALAPAEP
jgi:4-amino-4-deoxy-L-arabinose transferase-like glycosyltransferase